MRSAWNSSPPSLKPRKMPAVVSLVNSFIHISVQTRLPVAEVLRGLVVLPCLVVLSRRRSLRLGGSQDRSRLFAHARAPSGDSEDREEQENHRWRRPEDSQIPRPPVQPESSKRPPAKADRRYVHRSAQR